MREEAEVGGGRATERLAWQQRLHLMFSSVPEPSPRVAGASWVKDVKICFVQINDALKKSPKTRWVGVRRRRSPF